MFGKNNITYDKLQISEPSRTVMVPYGSDMPKDQEEINRDTMNKLYQSNYKLSGNVDRKMHDDDIVHTRKGQMSRTTTGMQSNYKGFNPEDFLEEKPTYEPLLEYFYKNGLIGESNVKKAFNYLHFDSSNIRRTATINCGDYIRLKENPLTFAENMLRIYVENIDMFNINELIILNGIVPKRLVMRTPIIPIEKDPFQFTQDTDHMMVLGPTNTVFNITTGNIPTYSDMTVSFDGFVGDTQTNYLYNVAQILTGRMEGMDGQDRIVFFEKLGAVYYDGKTTPEYYDPINRQYNGLIVWGYLEVNRAGMIVSMDSIENFYQNNQQLRWIDPADEKLYVDFPNIDFKRTDFLNLDDSEYPKIVQLNTQNPITIDRYMDWFKRMIVRLRTIFYDTITGINNIFQKYNANFIKDINIMKMLEIPQTTATIYNIPINYLNGSHQMYIQHDNQSIKKDTFYIQLNNSVDTTQYSYYQKNSLFVFGIRMRQLSDVTITYNHYGGIPINTMITELPIGFDSTAGYRQIYDINYNKKYIMIKLDRMPYFGNEYFGGTAIYISTIDKLNAEEKKNNYVINFPTCYANIASIRIINSIVPKTNPLITNGADQSIVNNKFYWQNLYDGDHLYNIVMETGYYDRQKFIDEFEKKIKMIVRVNSIDTRQTNYMKMNIDEGENKVTIVSYDVYEASYYPPYIDSYRVADKISDPYFRNIITNYIRIINRTLNFDTSYFVRIYYPQNRLVGGDTVVIDGSADYMGISANQLNTAHKIAAVESMHSIFYIVIENINILPSIQSSDYKGIGITLYTYCPFKIRFDPSDTIGNILGFRDIGIRTSVTTYNHIHTNKELYEGEINNDIQYRDIRFDGYPYLLMCVDEIPNVDNNGNLKNYFYKINLPDTNKTLKYDTFVDQPIYFTEPLKKLGRMTVKMMTPDNHPYQFNGADHSYTLEIITFDESPVGTNIRKR